MKKKIIPIYPAIFLFMLLVSGIVTAQAPEKMNYQAVVRDANGLLVVNQQIGIQISIIHELPDGTAVYVETQTPTTGSNGVVSIVIGEGSVVSGDFSSIDWGNGIYFIQTEVDIKGGTNYTITGISQLLSVPYALYAREAENTFSGDYNDLINTPNIPDFDGDFSSLTNIPTGLSDGDDDTQLTESEVDAFVANNGYLTAEVDGSVTNEIELPDQTDNAGKYLTTDGTDPAWTNLSVSYNDLTDIPADLSDGDDNTQLTESEVDAYVANNGYLTEEVDGSVTNEIELPDQTDNAGKYLTTDGTDPAWTNISVSYNDLTDIPADLSDGDDNTQLTESEVDAFVANNGYLTEEVDGSVTNEIELPDQTDNAGKYLTTDGTDPAWTTISVSYNDLTDIPADLSDGDDNTQLTESEVDAFVANNGYLTAEVDGSVTNEIELPDQSGHAGKVLTTDGTDPAWTTMSVSYNDLTDVPANIDTDATDDFDGAFSSLTGIPAGLSDGDDNTQLTESEVDAFVANNGYLTAEVDGSVTNEIELPDQSGHAGKVLTTDGTDPAWTSMSVSFNDLTDLPANLDTDATDDFDGAFSSLTGIPAGLSDGDDDTQLTEAQVDSYVSNNGYLTAEVDGSVTNEIELPTQTGNAGKLLTTDGTDPAWTTLSVSFNDLTDVPVNLDTDATDDFDGAFSSLTGIPAGLSDGDDDTQLTESQVDAYVANNGYLTAEVDGSVTNEIELPDQSGHAGKYLTTNGSSVSWATVSGSSPGVTTISANTTLTNSDEIVFINGAFTATFPASPVDGQRLVICATNSSAGINGNGKSIYVALASFTSLTFADASTNMYTFYYSSTLNAWLGNY